MTILTEDKAREILLKNITSTRMIRHSLAVAAGMRVMAQHFGEDPALWYSVGLIHDVDYEFNPVEHCLHVSEILAPEGIDDGIIHSISTHEYFKYPGTPMPKSLLERCLYTVDRISWVAVAVAYRSPDLGASLTTEDVMSMLNHGNLGNRLSREYILAVCDRAKISPELTAKCVAEGIRNNYYKISKAIL